MLSRTSSLTISIFLMAALISCGSQEGALDSTVAPPPPSTATPTTLDPTDEACQILTQRFTEFIMRDATNDDWKSMLRDLDRVPDLVPSRLTQDAIDYVAHQAELADIRLKFDSFAALLADPFWGDQYEAVSFNWTYDHAMSDPVFDWWEATCA